MLAAMATAALAATAAVDHRRRSACCINNGVACRVTTERPPQYILDGRTFLRGVEKQVKELGPPSTW